MAKTIDQIQTLITEKYDAREIINEIADYLQANPSGGGGAASYLVYTAILSQTGTDAPTAQVLENTLGTTIEWSRDVAGYYTGYSADAPFTVGKTIAMPFGGYQNMNTFITIADSPVAYYSVQPTNDATYFQVVVASDLAYTGVDLSTTSSKILIEVRVYA